MQNYFRSLGLKVFTAGSLVFAPLAGHAAVADMNFEGSTLGGFNGSAPVATTSLLGLTFWKSTFDITTADLTANLGGNPVVTTANFNNLGSFQLTAAPQSYVGNTFTLQVIFDAPTGIVGGNPAFYSATLTGRVVDSLTGGIIIDFDNAAKSFSFANPGGSGDFTLSVNDVPIQPNGLAAIGGTLTAIPEVTSILPLGAMLFSVGIGHTFSRRRRTVKAA